MNRQVLLAALLLSACGSPKSADPAAPAQASAEGPAKRWDATDACAVVDRAAMSAAIGATISETSVGLVHEANGAESATSECTYTLAEGGHASLMLRWSPIADNSDAAIAGTRSTLEQTLKAFGGGSVEPVPGLGKAAFWVERTNSLNVFIDDSSFAIINAPSGDKAKDQAITVARKLGA